MKRILSLFLVAFLLCCLPAVAFAEDGFNASLNVDRSVVGQIAVTVVHSSVLETLQPDLSIPCDESYAEAMVFFDGIACKADYADGYATFTVAKGGTYYIVIGAVPTGSTPATCVAAGRTVYVFHAEEYIETIEATGEHSYTTKASSELVSAATCTEAAIYYVQCDNCDAVSETETVSVGKENGHSFGIKASSEKASDATCTEAATYYVQCDNCDAVSETETVSVGEENGHDFSDTSKKTCANCFVSNPDYEEPYVPPYIPPYVPPVVTPDPEPTPEPDPEQGETVTIPAESGEEVTQVTVTVSDGSVKLEATEEDVADIIEKAEQAENGNEVKLDLSAMEQASSVTIPMELVEAVKDSEGVENLVIDLPSVSIVLDTKTLQTVVEAGTEGVKLQVNDKVDVETLTSEQQAELKDRDEGDVIIDLNMNVGEETVSNFDGTLTITIKYEPPKDTDHRKIVVKHVAKDGKTTYIRSNFREGRLSFGVNHFSVFATEICEMAKFGDVDLNAWYHDDIDYMAKTGLMVGTGADTFDPDMVLDRASIATILWRMEGRPTPSGTNPFADVKEGMWYTDAITWAAEAKLIYGYEDGLCHPNDVLTREQMVTILWRHAKMKGNINGQNVDTSMDTFSDANAVSGYARDAMIWAVENGIVFGTEYGLEPKLGSSRAQIAAIINRYMNN